MVPGFDDGYILNAIKHTDTLRCIVLELYGCVAALATRAPRDATLEGSFCTNVWSTFNSFIAPSRRAAGSLVHS